MAAYSLTSNKRRALDEHWYVRLQDIVGSLPEVYFVIGPSAQELERSEAQFLASNYTYDVDVRATHIDTRRYEVAQKQLATLRADIESQESNPFVVHAYRARIEELQQQNQLPIGVSRQNQDAFRSANTAIYGSPDKDIFYATSQWLQDFAIAQQNHPNAAVREAAKKAVGAIPVVPKSSVNIVPDEATFERVRALHFAPGGYIEQLFAGTKLPAIITHVNGDPIVQAVLATIGSTYALQDASDVFWGIMHSNKTVVRPANYHLERHEFQGILAHELGSHLLERLNGLRQPLQLLATGLDRYEAGNEGRAYLREQIMYQNTQEVVNEPSWEHIITIHYAISLAEGLHDHSYTFSELYQALLPISTLFETLRHEDATTIARAAHQQTWITVTRVLKGTAGSGNGAYLKDIVYLEGNVHCWQRAKDHPELILYGDLGKFDIARTDHIELLQALDILPIF